MTSLAQWSPMSKHSRGAGLPPLPPQLPAVQQYLQPGGRALIRLQVLQQVTTVVLTAPTQPDSRISNLLVLHMARLIHQLSHTRLLARHLHLPSVPTTPSNTS